MKHPRKAVAEVKRTIKAREHPPTPPKKPASPGHRPKKH